MGFWLQLNILLNGKPVDALSAVVHKSNVLATGKSLVHRLKETIPRCVHSGRPGFPVLYSCRILVLPRPLSRQLFEVTIQAAEGANKILARER